MRDEGTRLAELFWYAGGLLPLASVVLFWASMGDQPVNIQRSILFIIGAVIGGCGLLAFGEWIRPTPIASSLDASTPTSSNHSNKETPMSDKFTQNVTSYGQRGGITAGTVNFGPQRLVFSTELGNELLAKMPTKKKVFMKSVGGNADQEVAAQIQNFLQRNGYEISWTRIGMLVPPPDHKISLNEDGDSYFLIVAPSAN